MWVYSNKMPVLWWNEIVPLYFREIILNIPNYVSVEEQVWGQKIKSLSHAYIGAFRSKPFCISEIKTWFLDAMAIDTSIRNITVEGSLFPNVSPIPKTGLHNLANTWKRQVAPVSKVINHLLSKLQKLPKKKKKQRKKSHQSFKKEAHSTPHRGRQHPQLSFKLYNSRMGTRAWVLVPMLILARKHSGFICQTTVWDCKVYFLGLKHCNSEIQKYWLCFPIYSKRPNLQELLSFS